MTEHDDGYRIEPGTPRPRRRAGWWVAAALAVLVVAALLAVPVLRQYPAALETPDHLARRPSLPTIVLQPWLQQIGDAMRRRTGAERSVAAVYGTVEDADHMFALVGVTTLILAPHDALSRSFTPPERPGFDFGAARDVEPGPLGGSMRCAPGMFYRSTPMAVCGWADHGSLVLGLFLRADVDEAATAMRDIRRTILRR